MQARQTYVFSEAWRLGWKRDTAKRLAEAGVAVLTGPALAPSGLPGRTLAADGSGLRDASADLYDIAFVLFALAEAARGPAAPETCLPAARAILSALDETMKDRAHGGYAEALPPPGPRQQNPHMHLLEACLSLAKADPQADHPARAAEIVALFNTRFTAGPGGLLGETFLPDWSAPTGEAAEVVEPGHQFEWVWLLNTHARAAGLPRQRPWRGSILSVCPRLMRPDAPARQSRGPVPPRRIAPDMAADRSAEGASRHV